VGELSPPSLLAVKIHKASGKMYSVANAYLIVLFLR
jgi:hypothetical protein